MIKNAEGLPIQGEINFNNCLTFNFKEMKRSNLIKSGLLIGAILMIMSQLVTAQNRHSHNRWMSDSVPRYGQFNHSIPDLTEEQQTKIHELRTAHMKAMLKYRNEINEKEARLNTLQTEDNADMDKIYKVIDEIGALETEMNKKNALLRQEIRQLLNDDQRVFFDTRPFNKEHCIYHRQEKWHREGTGKQYRECPNFQHGEGMGSQYRKGPDKQYRKGPDNQ
jgi:Spy/CpxP family protein refolding chaperone